MDYMESTWKASRSAEKDRCTISRHGGINSKIEIQQTLDRNPNYYKHSIESGIRSNLILC